MWWWCESIFFSTPRWLSLSALYFPKRIETNNETKWKHCWSLNYFDPRDRERPNVFRKLARNTRGEEYFSTDRRKEREGRNGKYFRPRKFYKNFLSLPQRHVKYPTPTLINAGRKKISPHLGRRKKADKMQALSLSVLHMHPYYNTLCRHLQFITTHGRHPYTCIRETIANIFLLCKGMLSALNYPRCPLIQVFIYFSYLVNQNSQKVLLPKEIGHLFEKDDSFRHAKLTI